MSTPQQLEADEVALRLAREIAEELRKKIERKRKSA